MAVTMAHHQVIANFLACMGLEAAGSKSYNLDFSWPITICLAIPQSSCLFCLRNPLPCGLPLSLSSSGFVSLWRLDIDRRILP